jgi:amino acid transporter
LAEIHPRYKTPAAAIIIQTAISLVLALSGSFVELALLSIIARLITYIGTVAAVPVLRRKFGVDDQTFRLPGGYLIPVCALIICLVFLASTTFFNLIAGGIGLVIGAVIYFFWNGNT